MNVEGTILDAKQYTVQYELLRSQVIGTVGDAARGNTAGQPRGIGLARLLSEGLPGWLKTVEAVLRAVLAPERLTLPAPHRTGMPRGGAQRRCGCRASSVMKSPRYWRVWFSRLALWPANHPGRDIGHDNEK